MVAQSSGFKNISRVDSEKRDSHGWLMRLRYRGQSYSKFFSDETYGGEENALVEAVVYRDELEKEIGKPRTDRTIIVTQNTNTGVLGVKKTTKNNKPVFDVTWSAQPNKISRAWVWIEKYPDEEAAFRAACELRRAKEKEIYGSALGTDE